MIDYEFYETPRAFSHYLFRYMRDNDPRIEGTLLEPCVGSGAIVEAHSRYSRQWHPSEWQQPVREPWITNDLDEKWPAHSHVDARQFSLPHREIDWTVSNPPFTPAIEIIENALRFSRVGVAMHLRASIHEVLKTGVRRTWMATHPPTGILWLPRFAYQRSKTTGKWTTDSVGACWVIWLKPTLDPQPQFIDYAPEWVIDALDAETPAYRKRMDLLMGRVPRALP